MPRRQNRGFGDFPIPARGEARVLAEVKGSYGSKGAGMRRRGYRKGAAGGPKSLWAQANLENVNWINNTEEGNASGLLNGSGTQAIQRVMTINPGSLDADGTGDSDVERQAYVKRIIFKASMHAVLANLRVNGSSEVALNTIRDDIPGPGGLMGDDSGYTGYLLAGGINDSVSYWGPSAWEGIPITWWLIYETWKEAQDDISNYFDGFAKETYIKNRRVFAQGMLAPALTRPVMFSLDKRFPGRGVQLNNGDRDTWQISLLMQVAGGSGQEDRVGFQVGERRVMYYRP